MESFLRKAARFGASVIIIICSLSTTYASLTSDESKLWSYLIFMCTKFSVFLDLIALDDGLLYLVLCD